MTVTVSNSISYSTAEQVSEVIGTSYGATQGASCPDRENQYVGLFQYIVEGQTPLGMDQVATLITRCQYSPTQPVPVPQCPFEACGALATNPNCILSLCDDWKQ
jgi:hypothetical protein